MRNKAFTVILAVALVIVWILLFGAENSRASKAWYSKPVLSKVASTFAGRNVRIKCYARDEDESPWSYDAWGYVNVPLAKEKVAHLDYAMCEGAVDVNNPAIPKWKRALGPAVVIHESYHLRRWGAAGDEAKTECKTIRHWKVGMRLLGATEETIEDLWPIALYFHFRLAHDVPEYDEVGCEIPGVIPPEELEG